MNAGRGHRPTLTEQQALNARHTSLDVCRPYGLHAFDLQQPHLGFLQCSCQLGVKLGSRLALDLRHGLFSIPRFHEFAGLVPQRSGCPSRHWFAERITVLDQVFESFRQRRLCPVTYHRGSRCAAAGAEQAGRRGELVCTYVSVADLFLSVRCADSFSEDHSGDHTAPDHETLVPPLYIWRIS